MTEERAEKAEQQHPLLYLLRFIQEHLECAVTIRIDNGRILADCEKCCHSRNIPLGSMESFFRTSERALIESTKEKG